MSVMQVNGGPINLDLPQTMPYESGIVFEGPPPPSPFDASKRDYWAIAVGEAPVFGGQCIDKIATLEGVSATSCLDFVEYLLGDNGGPPSYKFDRFAVYEANLAKHPDKLGSDPDIDGWSSSVTEMVQLTGTTDQGGKFQGVLLRRWATAGNKFEEYWLLDAPQGCAGPGDTLDFSQVVQSAAKPKELIETFPDLLPHPKDAGLLSTFFLWYDVARWETLDQHKDKWQSQICG
jgi:hypothetical protein